MKKKKNRGPREVRKMTKKQQTKSRIKQKKMRKVEKEKK